MTNIYQLLHLLKKTPFLKLKISFLLLSIFCFSPAAVSQTTCNFPTNFAIASLTADSATITWTAANPVPSRGYSYYRTTNLDFEPGSGSTPDGHTTSNSLTINDLMANVNTYVWVRSRCQSSSVSEWNGPVRLRPVASGAGCPNAPYGLFPAQTYTPLYTQQPETITTAAYAGHYSNVNVVANRQYIFSTSVPTDYITITDATLNTILIHGPAPLTYISSTAETIRYYITTNAACGTQQTARSRYITAQLVPSNCPPPQSVTTSAISNNGAVLDWTGANQVHFYVSTSSSPPNPNTPPSGNPVHGNRHRINWLLPNTTYYYWIRSICGNDLSNWVGGGSFTTTTTVASGCDYTPYGQNPINPYTPGCFGNTEIIATDSWASQYSLVNIVPNRTYTFTSSVPTDFITISDGTTPFNYASGTTPLVWSSRDNTAQVRFYVHTTATCGFQSDVRTVAVSCQETSSCTPPSSISISSTTSSSAVINWSPASPIPGSGYQYYYSTSNTPPTANTTPSGNNAGTSLNLNGLAANTTYYIWIRSSCGSSKSIWVFGNSFTTVGAAAGCVTAIYGLHPTSTFVPACFGITENIVTDAYAGEYTNFTLLANRQYTFGSSVSSDYITISNADATIIYVTGMTPLIWSSGPVSGNMRFYIHSNAACGSEPLSRTKTIICQAAAATCNNPTSPSAAPSSNAAVLSWVAASPQPSNGYQYYYNTAPTAPTSSTAPSGTATGTTVTLSGLAANTSYYFWVRSNCGTSQAGWLSGGSFTTFGSSFCNNATHGQFPFSAFVPVCAGSAELIADNAYAGEYTVVTATAGRQYTFSSSVATDYVTITNESGTTQIASGTTPLIWNSGAHAGNIRYYLHTSAACGEQNENRSKFISCAGSSGACAAPANLQTANTTSNSCMISYTASSTAGATYDVYFSTAAVAPTANTTPAGNVTQNRVFLYNLLSATNYHYWIRANCGTTTSAWVSGGSFTTTAALTCNSARYGLYPETTFMPLCTGFNENIVLDAYAGEFAKVAIVSNRQYRFASSKATDFITITNESGTAVLASGVTPLVWHSSGNTGIIRYFIHADASCDNQDQLRVRSIVCSNTLSDVDFSANTLQIYPNPTDGIINITARQTFDKIEIINQLGQTVKVFLTHSNQVQIDLLDLATGMYFAKIHIGKANAIYKIIKD